MKKLTLTIVSILSVVAIFGVGFAAWVIINPNVTADQTGNITVETVTDKSYSLAAEFDKTSDTTNGNISFGYPENALTSGWLRGDNSTATEKLTATLTLTLTYKVWDNVIPDTLNLSIATKSTKTGATADDDTAVASKFAAVSTAGEGEKQLVSNTVQLSYGTNKTASAVINGASSVAQIETASFTKSASNVDDTTTDKTATLTVTLTFAWGSYFTLTQGSGSTVVNPYVFYSGKSYDDYKDDAKTNLESIQTNLGTEVGYKLTITGTTKGTNA